MEYADWRAEIRKACEDAGTYRPFFDQAIDTLAMILQQRDETEAFYDGEPVKEYVNSRHESNMRKNPVLVLLMDLNSQALSYWRDLGLTPAGYKKLNADVVNAKGSGFAELLEATLNDV